MGAFMWATSWRAWLLLALVVGAWFHGHHVGADGVTADWAASDREREAAAIAAARDNTQRAHAAATDYEAAKARGAAALASTRAELRNALQRPICPPGGHEETDDAPTIADLPVPADAVDRLRRAAAGGDGA